MRLPDIVRELLDDHEGLNLTFKVSRIYSGDWDTYYVFYINSDDISIKSNTYYSKDNNSDILKNNKLITIDEFKSDVNKLINKLNKVVGNE